MGGGRIEASIKTPTNRVIHGKKFREGQEVRYRHVSQAQRRRLYVPRAVAPGFPRTDALPNGLFSVAGFHGL